jgi:hypothetical protein
LPNWLSLLSVAVSLIPQTAQEISAAISDHWGKDHVQQLAQGAQLLGQVASTVAKAVTDRQGVQTAAPAATVSPAIDYDALAAAMIKAQAAQK